VVITIPCRAAAPSFGDRRPELAGLDRVLARAMAKTPADRLASCREFDSELQRLLGSPSAHFHTPPPQQPPTQPSQIATASAIGTGVQQVSRSKVRLAALSVIPLLIVAGGVFAGVTFFGHRNQAGTASPSATAAANTHSFTGTYRADYGPGTDLEGKPVAGAPAMTGTWDVRSTCGSSGCVATASYVGGSGIVLVSNLEFDQIGGRWVAVGLGSTPCNNAPAEVWVVFTLQPQPDGTLSGETTRSTTNSCSAGKRSVTFTRTGDPDVAKVPDPAALPPRAASPATALHGRYHETITYANGNSAPGQDDLTVRTECLRTGERCMSLFHAPDGVVPLVFSGGKWTRDDEGTVPCNLGGTVHIKLTAEYPLPDPLQDPIPVLTGRGQNVTTGSACVGGDFEDKFERTGD
jgi:serine/threonine protein kinase, bacterial